MNIRKRVILNRRAGGVPAVPSFRIEVKTDNAGTSASNQFTIPTNGTYLYDYTTSDGQSATGLTGNTTITFASGPGTYEISITGLFPKIFFNNLGDKLKLLQVLEWGIYGEFEVVQANTFRGCNNLWKIGEDVGFFNNFSNCNNMFFDCGLTTLPLLTSFNNLSSCALMFRNCSLTDLPPLIQLGAITSATAMFFGNTINTTRYSKLLEDMEAINPFNNVPFGGGNSKYNATNGLTARNILTSAPRLWTITDGGLE